MTVELVQHTARKDSAPSPACVAAMRELLGHLQEDVVQRHLRLGVMARKQGVWGVSAAQRQTRLRALRGALGKADFEVIWKICEQSRAVNA